MASEWLTKTIGEVAEVIGGGTPSTKIKNNFGGDIPWLTPKDLSQLHPRYIKEGSRNLTEEGLNSCSSRLLPKNTVLLSSRAPIGYVAIAANPIATNQGFRSLVVRSGYHYEFIYYWLLGNVEKLRQHATGSTFKELSGTALKAIEIKLPACIEEQRAIAHILGTLDDKIELNRRQNETLEAMARALFKAWFVDFEPVRAKMDGRWQRGQSLPGLPAHLYDLFPDRLVESELGLIPEGWEITTLSNYSELNPESWNKRTMPEKIQYIDLSGVKWGRIENVVTYEGKTAPSRARRILKPLDTIVGTVRPGNGSYTLVAEEGLTGSTGFAVLRPLKQEYSEIVYLASTSDQNIKSLADLADGAAYPAVRPAAVLGTAVPKVSDEVSSEFSDFTAPLFSAVAENERKSIDLALLRDTLLPRLISGKLRVADA